MPGGGGRKTKKKQKKKGSQNEISLVFRANGVSFGAGFFHRFSGKFKRRFHRQKRRRHQSYQRRSEPPGSPLRPQPQVIIPLANIYYDFHGNWIIGWGEETGWGGPLGSNIKDSRGAALSLTLIANPLKVIAIDNKVIDG